MCRSCSFQLDKTRVSQWQLGSDSQPEALSYMEKQSSVCLGLHFNPGQKEQIKAGLREMGGFGLNFLLFQYLQFSSCEFLNPFGHFHGLFSETEEK